MRSSPRAGLAILAVFVIGCGGDSEGPMEPMEPMEPEIVTDPPPAVLTGRVLVANTFTVPPTDDPLLLAIYSSGGVIPADVGPTAGRLLVFSLRDASRPDFVCTDLTSSSAATGPTRSHQRSDCAILVVEPTEDEGFVSVESSSGRVNYYLQSTFQLLLNPEPA
ncbi:MAG: hypothetical protein IH968_08390 [Gemmatimonadetes bacterium]|nr:hypothetical protein [Gemmatimonadota bacterium]